MKKIIYVLTFTATIFLFSCKSGGGGATPTAAIKAMASDAKDGNFKKMSAHFCKADKEMFDKMIPLMEAAAKMAGKDIKEMMKEEMNKDGRMNFNDVEFKNEKIDGDKATVEVINKKENKTETLNFVKESGAWKVCMGMADKAAAGMKGEDFEKGLDQAKKALENMKPEDMEKMQKAMQEGLKNMKPEDLEKFKKMGEQMQKAN